MTAQKTTTLTRMVTPTRLIPAVTVQTVDTQKHVKTQNVRMVTPTRPIHLTVYTFDMFTYQRSQSCYLPYLLLPRGASVADAARVSMLQKFQLQITSTPNNSNCCAVFVTFSRTRNAVLYRVGSLSRSANVKNSEHKKQWGWRKAPPYFLT